MHLKDFDMTQQCQQQYQSILKPVYSDRPKETQKVAFVDRFF